GMHFIFYRVILILDKKDPNSVHISVLDIKDRSYQSASEVMRNVKNTLLTRVSPARKGSALKYPYGTLTSNFTKPGYISAVKKALEYIHAGDIYQVCLSQRFRSEWHGHPYELYRGLNAINPAPFSAFLDYGDHSIISSSPELFLRVSEDSIETRPMKGTRPRGKTPEEDILLKEELLSSAKDAAELLMIVDLERNDLGRSSLPGTVRVSENRRLEPHPTVFQTISVIRGSLDKRYGLMDVLRNAFPGGSITGCPKIRAMEIIEELEPTKRGIYTGSIGYISLHGSMDLNIAIRTMIKKGPEVYFQVGSGIVSDSDPETEYEETLHKARALIQAVS
ncbi:MAG: aminodeoxychorismate synthase component I, partial [Candidatus Omnitrophota bacterium]